LRIYLPEKKRVMRPKSYTSVERHLLRYAKPLHGLGLALVTRRDVASLLAGVAAASGSVSANRTRASLSGFFTWAMQRGLTEAANPVAGTHVAPEQARSRVLTIEELAAVWRHAGDDSFGKAIRLLILTACRAAEIGGLLWGEIRDGMIVLPAERVKTGRPHVVPIPGPAQSILSTIARDRYGDHVFARGGFRSWSYGKRQLDARLAAAALRVELWTIHDLRRSAATHMGELGVSPHVIEAVLNHAGHRAGVGGIYNRSGYEREKRAALDMWADHVIAALDGEESKVVSLHA
jgi:integrase